MQACGHARNVLLPVNHPPCNRYSGVGIRLLEEMERLDACDRQKKVAVSVSNETKRKPVAPSRLMFAIVCGGRSWRTDKIRECVWSMWHLS